MQDTRTCWAPGDQEHDHAMCEDSTEERDSSAAAVDEYLALSWDLYTLFVALVDWCRKAGRTEVNAVRAAGEALRALDVDETVIAGIRRRYAAGTRATAELDHADKL